MIGDALSEARKTYRMSYQNRRLAPPSAAKSRLNNSRHSITPHPPPLTDRREQFIENLMRASPVFARIPV
jgi:hypothetical protein